MAADPHYVRIPLRIFVGKEEFVDDGSIRQQALLSAMKHCHEAPKTACPSPAHYMEHFDEAEDVYIVTLSDRLSGSCNAANQAVTFYREEGGGHNVHVFNSRSASAGQVQAALLIRELAAQGLPFQEVVDRVERYLDEMDTMFVLENLDNLRKNGRLSRMQSLVTSTLRIKLLLGSTPEGEICKKGQAMSVKQALSKMASLMAANPNHAGKRLSIVHCNCLERAYHLRELALKQCQFSEILISETGGISTVYANDGGVVAAY